MRVFEVIEPSISNLDIEYCLLKDYDYTELEELLNRLKGKVGVSQDGVLLINTLNEKRLAVAVLYAVKELFEKDDAGKYKRWRQSERDKAIRHIERWVSTRTDTEPSPRECVEIVKRNLEKYLQGVDIADEMKEEARAAVETWSDDKLKQAVGTGNESEESKKNHINGKREINEEELSKHFNAKFKGAGNSENYFELLVSDLKDLSTKKDFSIVARMIYESNSGFINTFTTFAAWCRAFFESTGITVSEKYNFSKYAPPTKELKNKFYYLV